MTYPDGYVVNYNYGSGLNDTISWLSSLSDTGKKSSDADYLNLGRPKVNAMESRYEGKPLLRLLECWVLDAIGRLPDTDRSNLEKMTPKLRALYKLQGDWQSIISGVMDFPGDLAGHIRSLWNRNLDTAVQSGVELDAEEFARRIVDENLARG